MADTDIEVTRTEHVATIEIQRPPHNFFDRELIRQIADALEALDEEPDCRAVVLASTGKSFCAGANLGGGTTERSADEDFNATGFRKRVGLLYGQGARLFGTRKPIVGAIHGPAIGGGLGLARSRTSEWPLPKRASQRILQNLVFIQALLYPSHCLRSLESARRISCS